MQADYTKTIEINPTAVVYLTRGNAKLFILDYSGAIADYTKAIEFNPKDAESYFNRGLARIAIKEKNKGCLDFSKAGELGISKAYEIISVHCK